MGVKLFFQLAIELPGNPSMIDIGLCNSGPMECDIGKLGTRGAALEYTCECLTTAVHFCLFDLSSVHRGFCQSHASCMLTLGTGPPHCQRKLCIKTSLLD